MLMMFDMNCKGSCEVLFERGRSELKGKLLRMLM